MDEECLYGLVILDKAEAERLLQMRWVFLEADRLLNGSAVSLSRHDEPMVAFFESGTPDIRDLIQRLETTDNWIAIPDDRKADFSRLPEIPRDSDSRDEVVITADGVSWEVPLMDYENMVRTCELPWEAITAVAWEQEPRNNDGRSLCWWCGGPTRKMTLLSNNTDFCDECGK